jgi:hypothetical protein
MFNWVRDDEGHNILHVAGGVGAKWASIDDVFGEKVMPSIQIMDYGDVIPSRDVEWYGVGDIYEVKFCGSLNSWTCRLGTGVLALSDAQQLLRDVVDKRGVMPDLVDVAERAGLNWRGRAAALVVWNDSQSRGAGDVMVTLALGQVEDAFYLRVEGEPHRPAWDLVAGAVGLHSFEGARFVNGGGGSCVGVVDMDMEQAESVLLKLFMCPAIARK